MARFSQRCNPEAALQKVTFQRSRRFSPVQQEAKSGSINSQTPKVMLMVGQIRSRNAQHRRKKVSTAARDLSYCF
ncbi:hypothetical protein AMECASPLE_038101 [Ameca splendens]|uniref:Uncharacterized protein n=1 Tax=Ameca splendens TaxID=208324 RepID=A0ABV0Z5Z7_9TELE